MNRLEARICAALLTLLMSLVSAQGAETDPEAAWAKAATPGKAHAELQEQVGEWRYVVKFWQKPGTEPTTSGGTAVKRMVMGGRFLEEEVTGEYQGRQFHGRGLTGFNNVTGRYEATWVDDSGTALHFYDGKPDGKGGREYASTFHDPVSGRAVAIRSVSRTVDRDHTTYESYTTSQDGKESLVMRIEYTRAAR